VVDYKCNSHVGFVVDGPRAVDQVLDEADKEKIRESSNKEGEK
jgi:hypothetical protein